MSAQIGYVPKAILKELRFSDYFKVSCFRWGIYSWIEFYKQKFSKATTQQSYEALHDELEILLQRLSKVSKVYAKTKSLQESLQVSIFCVSRKVRVKSSLVSEMVHMTESHTLRFYRVTWLMVESGNGEATLRFYRVT
ncbi:hypothetical protein BC936DRAFT_144430 [Jimgerdemannia flammicorona]|uniref:Uncharacterized protein n=1 Tax=Jimgerdemannia flammicorona TaxID=994334 RepID=A0A433DCH8_9FUNG|nr:hypothetical protein BC936DRAFT_144430 [Jimgerdemannia flammicorona]